MFIAIFVTLIIITVSKFSVASVARIITVIGLGV